MGARCHGCVAATMPSVSTMGIIGFFIVGFVMCLQPIQASTAASPVDRSHVDACPDGDWCEAADNSLVQVMGTKRSRPSAPNSVPNTTVATSVIPGQTPESRLSPFPPMKPVLRKPRDVMDGWFTGTWVTGYWDCCKPSCGWPGKGNVNRPITSCSAEGGGVVSANEPSVCEGGLAAACPNMQPLIHSANLAMGFAAAATDGTDGLTGDENCGQCFELKFVDQEHSDGNWGGSAPELVGKRMVVQVTNIGYDVTGDHTFDLQIPGAGQGAFDHGCAAQFQGHPSTDFDCDNRYGGCNSKEGCGRLPEELRAGCEWRYDWFHWLQADGKTNNPYVDFRRVKCPEQLTSISGSVPMDDDELPTVDLDSSPPHPAGSGPPRPVPGRS
mmetsp:Transcript_75870/g.191769  ORF Transcript_75870/g.191769 Transcript_75870/m.191769 type:complete len:384 (-) Transcript_75870:30-1181(-)